MHIMVLVALLTLFSGSQAWAACSNTWTVKDGGGASRTFCRGTDGGSNYVSYFNLVDATGANIASISAGGALKVDNSAVTQPISAASLPLPTGASTAAKQPALGTAGTASSDVITVQGITSMTPLYNIIRDAAGNARGANVDASNRLSVSVDNIANSTGGAPDSAVPSTAGYSGGRATTTEPAAVSDGDLVGARMDVTGRQIVLLGANPEYYVSGVISSAMTGTTSTSLVAAPGASLRNYITACTFSNGHATVGTDMILQDGSGGTTIWIIPAAAVYGGAHITFPTPLRQPTTNTALYIANVTTGASTKASCSGYKGA
jgi:hypothetical protein